MADLPADKLIEATDALWTDRAPWEAGWSAVSDYMLPDGVDFNQQDVAGASRRDRIVSNYGETALEEAADGLIGLACAPGTRWKGLSIPGLDENSHMERLWLERANDLMMGVYESPRSRWHSAIKAYFLEWLGYGNACMFLAGRPGQIPIFEHRPLAEIAGAEGEDGFIDEVCWKFKWTARKAMQRWGELPTFPDAIRKKAEHPTQRLELCEFRHYVYPRHDYDEQSRAAKDRPYRECWLSVEGKALIEEGGYFSFPYNLGRLDKRGSWAYGRGRGRKALAEIKMLQRVRRATIQGAEKVINPPTQGPDDTGVPDLRPGMHNFMRPEYLMRNGGFQPISTGARPDIGQDFEESVKADAVGPLLGKVLNIKREPRMLVDQELAQQADAMRSAAPIVAEAQIEVLGPIDGRLFDIMQRDMAFGDPRAFPESIKARPIQPDFETPSARVMLLGTARAIAQRNQMMLEIWKARPDLLDVEDWPTTQRTLNRVLGVPADCSLSPQRYEAVQAARNQAAQQQHQLEAGKDVTTMVKNATPAAKLVVDNTQGAGGMAAPSDGVAA